MQAPPSTANGRSWSFWNPRGPLSDPEKQQQVPATELPTSANSFVVGGGWSANTQGSSPSAKSLRITVGRDSVQRVFRLPKDKLCACSDYFREACGKWGSSDNLELLDDNPVVFDLFSKWVQNQQPPTPYDPARTSAAEPWVSNAAAAWVLGKKLRSADFKKYALSMFIQTCALATFGPWEYVEREAPADSPIRRFSDHWVAWNSYLAGKQPNEYSGLKGASRTFMANKETRDPRIYGIDHWYLSCGKLMNPKCDHDPEVVQQKAMDDARRAIVPQADYGRDIETRTKANKPSGGGLAHTRPYYGNMYSTPTTYYQKRRGGCATTVIALLCVGSSLSHMPKPTYAYLS
ncbi:uncharacterized protein BP5553_06356 [Venustampulla echinocandica]|uniref:BTB domain-containing protein n=1 Tax=Venustampulla echinocandica TaxID=2656787 RepID=A0A370TJP9_9HELO|nr:uncharacterized protein BP5553_06356 [Venustampulla echinocandica]RDL35744.1 hypothetical protein BP5553_06356 [Venustampulla echinocandica]